MLVFVKRHLDILIAVVFAVVLFSIGLNIYSIFITVFNLFTCYAVIRNEIKHKAVIATLEECSEYYEVGVRNVKLAIEAMDNFQERYNEHEENMTIINQNIQTLNGNMEVLVNSINKLKQERNKPEDATRFHNADH